MNGYCSVLYRHLKNRLSGTKLRSAEECIGELFDCRYETVCPERAECRQVLDHLVDQWQPDMNSRKSGMSNLPTSATYKFQTLDDAVNITDSVRKEFPEIADIEIALWELMVNAIEHGNLQIGFEAKTKLLDSAVLLDEIEQRLNDEKYRDRWATLIIERKLGKLKITVVDEGPGFDWKRYIKQRQSDNDGYHGRGIAMAKSSLKTLTYCGSGNTAVVEFP